VNGLVLAANEDVGAITATTSLIEPLVAVITKPPPKRYPPIPPTRQTVNVPASLR